MAYDYKHTNNPDDAFDYTENEPIVLPTTVDNEYTHYLFEIEIEDEGYHDIGLLFYHESSSNFELPVSRITVQHVGDTIGIDEGQSSGETPGTVPGNQWNQVDKS